MREKLADWATETDSGLPGSRWTTGGVSANPAGATSVAMQAAATPARRRGWSAASPPSPRLGGGGAAGERGAAATAWAGAGLWARARRCGFGAR